MRGVSQVNVEANRSHRAVTCSQLERILMQKCGYVLIILSVEMARLDS